LACGDDERAGFESINYGDLVAARRAEPYESLPRDETAARVVLPCRRILLGQEN
jgi:hypothetical protein